MSVVKDLDLNLLWTYHPMKCKTLLGKYGWGLVDKFSFKEWFLHTNQGSSHLFFQQTDHIQCSQINCWCVSYIKCRHTKAFLINGNGTVYRKKIVMFVLVVSGIYVNNDENWLNYHFQTQLQVTNRIERALGYAFCGEFVEYCSILVSKDETISAL